ncbi:hypothetical protein F4703DRAFT_1798297 [Phycomyces blakesleeanus]|uniref:Uncharacterized protein n=2 Tax=Phycomyces blakesleeanus TaxID=4837 RepID=A0A162TC97_PHYB8|nr:hypothetical protein PHYBLDRAFT_175711 [Phycomyces blakesleeanus NRRL 1555(-)]OAD65973.1 hypothetical protein PHYBLDRAFT_175711 [Phycomyces blakesleeanus NRRL 1555(-)]|eukprot:XP_018284013.1 hypothetical protein PHYBLDRAFT_175711 [Phycomyces blakesleeanus NRRL 1555(-)]
MSRLAVAQPILQTTKASYDGKSSLTITQKVQESAGIQPGLYLGDKWFSEAMDQPPHHSVPSLPYEYPQKSFISFVLHKATSPSLQKRSIGPPFSSASHNTPAFNVIHVIAGVLGGLGATLVGVTMFLMCRKKRKKRDNSLDIESKPVTPAPSIPSNNLKGTSSSSSASTCPTDRFDQFAIDFCYEERQQASTHNSISSCTTLPAEIDLSDDPVSPSMQQHRLQYLILQQQLKSQAASSSRPNATKPPPPYHP